MIVDVNCDDETVQIARIIHEHADMYAVNFLEKYKTGYVFSKDTELVPKDSIAGFYDVENLEDTNLYMKVGDIYELIDDSEDEDFCYSETDDSESESLIEETDDEA